MDDNNHVHHAHKLSLLSLGIAIGFAEGLYMMVFAWLGWLWGYGIPIIHELATVMFAPSFIGGIMGGILGFIDGFIFGVIVAIFYNLCVCCRCKKSSSA